MSHVIQSGQAYLDENHNYVRIIEIDRKTNNVWSAHWDEAEERWQVEIHLLDTVVGWTFQEPTPAQPEVAPPPYTDGIPVAESYKFDGYANVLLGYYNGEHEGLAVVCYRPLDSNALIPSDWSICHIPASVVDNWERNPPSVPYVPGGVAPVVPARMYYNSQGDNCMVIHGADLGPLPEGKVLTLIQSAESHQWIQYVVDAEVLNTWRLCETEDDGTVELSTDSHKELTAEYTGHSVVPLEDAPKDCRILAESIQQQAIADTVMLQGAIAEGTPCEGGKFAGCGKVGPDGCGEEALCSQGGIDIETEGVNQLSKVSDEEVAVMRKLLHEAEGKTRREAIAEAVIAKAKEGAPVQDFGLDVSAHNVPATEGSFPLLTGNEEVDPATGIPILRTTKQAPEEPAKEADALEELGTSMVQIASVLHGTQAQLERLVNVLYERKVLSVEAYRVVVGVVLEEGERDDA